MITKLTSQIAKDLVDFFAKYNIKITAQYTPELPGIISYSRNFLAKTLSSNPIDIDGKLYQNKLLYKVDTPKLASFASHSSQLSVVKGLEDINQDYTMEYNPAGFSKIRTSTTDGLVKVRDVTIMEIPLEFCLITENLDLVFAITTLFYQQLVNQNVLTLGINLFADDILVELPYFLNWDREQLEISYANFETNNALNTISFKLKISGAVFSEFYTEDYVINKYSLTIENIQ